MLKYRRLTRSDRYQIERGLAQDKRIICIADKVGKHRSTIYREIKRGQNTQGTTGISKKGEYRALGAQRKFLSRNSRRRGFLYRGYKIKGWVEDQIRLKISQGWSPQQVSNRMKMEHGFLVSTEAIYKYLLSMKRRQDKLYQCLRRYRRGRRRFKRRNRYWELQSRRRKSIDDRPIEANKRLENGHWERDLMNGQHRTGALVVLADRKSQITLLERVRQKQASEVNAATIKALRRSKQIIRSMTNDNGSEMGEFWKLEAELMVPVYFTHPLCPWERGTVENTIGLLRQYIPKGTDLTKVSDEYIKAIELAINSRPRKSLGYKTPLEALTGKTQQLIEKKEFEPEPPEYYEQFYYTPEEIEELNKLRGKSVALGG